MPSMPLTEAARALGVYPSTLRRWIQRGAPCERLGGVGRGNGSLVDVEAIRRWRSGGNDVGASELLAELDEAMVDFLRRSSGLDGQPAHLSLGLKEHIAAAYLAVLFRYFEKRVGGSATEHQAQIERACAVLVDSHQHKIKTRIPQ